MEWPLFILSNRVQKDHNQIEQHEKPKRLEMRKYVHASYSFSASIHLSLCAFICTPTGFAESPTGERFHVCLILRGVNALVGDRWEYSLLIHCLLCHSPFCVNLILCHSPSVSFLLLCHSPSVSFSSFIHFEQRIFIHQRHSLLFKAPVLPPKTSFFSYIILDNMSLRSLLLYSWVFNLNSGYFRFCIAYIPASL